MLIIYLYLFVTIFFVLEKTLCEATVHEGLTKVLLGGYTNVRTVQLLNQLCNDSQDEDDVVGRDACYGCFFRASNRPSGYPMLLSMSACANLYLDDSNYGHCSAYLKNATSNAETRATPTTIYCMFLECIRQVNKDSLEALVALRNGKKIVGTGVPRGFIITRYVFARRGICIVKNTGRSTTVSPTTGVIDPRDSSVRERGPGYNP
ncbi:uncharacterized protein LOC135161842 isoform X3 [Diachasmimorpha longicaudata]|uniref:uncharacterized protein LOC135161842 isoform X3 n=1 Tax=Diachasmimorpha longicaudata TaxID=58733 RepID=UPI0030B87796